MSSLISHTTLKEFNIDAFIAEADSPEQKETIKQLASFELGRFLLTNKGLNGYWTAYAIIHSLNMTHLSELERWLTHEAPIVIATRERFYIFKELLQKQLQDDTHLASMPCGLMDDLMGLDYSNFENIKLTGIDLDPESIELAKQNAQKYGLTQVNFVEANAWTHQFEDTFDVLTSNGLNVYEPDEAKVLELYRAFNRALKKEGVLITSFLTPPPTLSAESPWIINQPAALAKQKHILADTCKVAWQNFTTETEIRDQLETTGFKVEQVIYDNQRMFPTVIARKVAFE